MGGFRYYFTVASSKKEDLRFFLTQQLFEYRFRDEAKYISVYLKLRVGEHIAAFMTQPELQVQSCSEIPRIRDEYLISS